MVVEYSSTKYTIHRFGTSDLPASESRVFRGDGDDSLVTVFRRDRRGLMRKFAELRRVPGLWSGMGYIALVRAG